ncbi:class I adenylate-forming enzyme family protein [Phyllobacterium zundukense]|uniref:3-methylmercaptopropionyl-CoA ligase n=1 Tax=Phyllobacterium zundukense TaxID=1867719 RepID=A0A2N9W0L0_9HYPH|nr:AMP-binding protein [Phyllobacterium zundukense]ATU95472.1 AMP-dependent synthetase [Phyllobacterium zundukense]PIO45278.1 AMP-dependent synthetase [Phyllobacterium zundukense]
MENAVMTTVASEASQKFGDAIALTLPGNESLTFKEIDLRAGQFAGGLLSLGISSGDRVVLYLPNGWEWIVAYHAIARLGAVVVPANILLSPDEVSYIASDSDARAVILPTDRLDQVEHTKGRLFIAPDGGDRGFGEVLSGHYLAPVARDPDDLFKIGYTSGTTGRPKGAMLTHANVFWSMASTATVHVRHRSDVILSALPLPHVYGNIVMNSAMQSGARLVLLPRFEPARALELIAAEHVTLFDGVPTMYYQMLANPNIATADLSSLNRCTVGGQTMPTAKMEAVVDRFGCPLLELWGMTEVAGPAVSHSPFWPARHGSIGLAFPAMEVRIASLEHPNDDARNGEPGELMVRGPLVMKGYWNDPSATALVLDERGWLASGDVAVRDGDGYVFVVDRKKDMIITAGYNIYPAELEQVVAMHSGVAMVAVAGVPDEEKGEIAQAFVVLHAGVTLEEPELLLHCRQHLAAYKIPRRIAFVEDLPKTSTGKILRRTLREDARNQSTKPSA